MNLAQNLLVKSAVAPVSNASTAALYNGASVGGSNGIDTKDFDQALVVVNIGTHGDDVEVSVFTSDTNNSSAAVQYSDTAGNAATITITAAGVNVLNIQTQWAKRYLWVKTTQAGAGPNVYSASVILGAADANKVTQDNTVQFNG